MLVSVREASELLACGRPFLYELIASGQLPKVKLGRQHGRVIRRSLYAETREEAARLLRAAIKRGRARIRTWDRGVMSPLL